ncbi:hypothetical protein LSG25_19015 [Paralcaligenes sp. KSB-10]|uniref:four-carbon acid sugar kinase family protein n=1 Tax=Paralcaligenes sp. KSB-10 TaxID=2901142 RepID=UPI001E3AD027|nr:four-carbon acid sugar kinase family protein [Paralcaligenes sp. KSB-10]UHL64082.1 hypothetical protein LSG25_19015 [Paralcaligenes sp. KSB-10]
MDKQETGIGSPPGLPYPSHGSLNEPGFGSRRFLVVADDLTGAADAAVALAGAKYSAEIFLDPTLAYNTDRVVTAVDLDTRRMPPTEAARTIASFFATRQAGDTLLFKKLDSTLRGHVGAELDALQQAIAPQRTPQQPPALFIVAPAHPLLGRAFINGKLELKDASAEPGGPGRDSPPSNEAVSIRSQLESFGFDCTCLAIENLQGSDIQETAKLVQHAATGPKPALLCDARTVDDMRRIVAAALAARTRCIWVGSGGLASVLSEFLPGPDLAEIQAYPGKKTSPGSTLFLVGSFSATARRQIQELSKTTQVQLLPLTIDEVAGHPEHSAEHLIDKAITNQQDMAVYIDPKQSLRPDLSPAYAARMAALIAPRLGQLGALVCCGGDTTRALFDKLQLTHLQAHNTHEPGVTHVYSRHWPQLPILIKAGAFGDAQTLLRLRQHLEPS